MLYARPETRLLVADLLSGGKLPEQRTEKFSYEIEDSKLYIKLARPACRHEMAELIDPVSEAIKARKKAALEEYEKVAKRLTPGERATVKRAITHMQPSELAIAAASAAEARAARPAPVTEYGEWCQGFGGIMCAKIPLLTQTSKMGCNSFNLPAGPTDKFGGTCPASGFGFPMLKPAERPKKGSRWFDPSKVEPNRWLCSGCYGLKGLYGSPMMVFMMEVRKQFVEAMLKLDPRGLTDILARAIRMGQASSLVERFFLEQMGGSFRDEAWKIAAPEYFRIHDVGDVWRADYLQVWFDVCRELSHPFHAEQLGLTLPAVRFWMPTRMWMLPMFPKNVECKGIEGCVPDNLTIRPSAGHFGDKAPLLDASGLVSGSGSTFMTEQMSAEDKKAAEHVVGKFAQASGKGWICPAYLAPEMGGGAEWLEKKLRHGKYRTLVNGACQRSFGPDTKPAPEGTGCRVCWNNPDMPVVYPEH